MAKKQTRRSISVSRTLYERAKLAADASGQSLSAMTERAIATEIATTVSDPSKPLPSPAAKVEAVLARVMPGANRMNPAAWDRLVAEVLRAAQPPIDETAVAVVAAQRDGDSLLRGVTRHG